MAQMNLFAGQEQRHGSIEWPCGHSGEGRVGPTESRVAVYSSLCLKQLVGSCSIDREPNPALFGDVEGWVGGEVQEREKIYVLTAESLC